MKGIESKKASFMIMLMLSVFIVLSGCSGGGELGGGHWIQPGAAPTVTAVAPSSGTTDVPINTKLIIAAFSQAMVPASLNTNSFTLTCNGTRITGGGAVTYLADGNAATLPLPAATDLPGGAACTARITTEARDQTGVTLVNDFTWSFITGSAPDTARPVITSTVPATTIPGPTFGAPANTAITAVFNKDMSPATITRAGAFTVTGPGAIPVTAAVPAVTYDMASNTATFHPAGVLTAGTYTVTIKGTGTDPVKDLAGNALAGNPALPLAANDYVWSFTATAATDTTRPGVTATIPATTIPGPTLGVPSNTVITALFNEDMSPATITAPGTITVTGPGATPVTAAVPAVTYDIASNSATFHPAAALIAGTYTVIIKGTGTNPAKDLAGNALAGNPALPLVANDYVWSFTTTATADTTRPIVTVTVPATTTPGPTPGVATTTTISAVFNEDMSPATITATGAVTVTGPGATPVIAAVPAVTYNAVTRTAIFHPATALAPNETYTATIKGLGVSPAKDSAGNALAGNPALPLVANDYVWSFTTGAVVHVGPEAINLGSAGTFRVLAGSAITNTDIVTNRTSVNGDVGVSPGTTVNGFTELLNIVPTFQLFAGGPIADLAKVDLLVAYNDAQSRSTAAISLPGQIGGLTLAPGLYVNSTTSGISGTGPNGILTLDGQGDSNAVWIFKMGSTLITDPGTSIVCVNGCNAENIYWQVGSSATLGTNSIFYGTILSDISVTMNTGATLHGRALTRVGAVSLDTNQIVP
jgi:Ice-binding-like/Bacterial Ig-like domain